VIEEDEGSHHLPAAGRQEASHLEAAEVARTRCDDPLDHD
jgi:hypothetical protein